MSQQLDLRSISALNDFSKAIDKHGDSIESDMLQAVKELTRSLDWIRERVNHWKIEREKAVKILEKLKSELQNCQNRSQRNQEGDRQQQDCSRELQEYRKAELHFRECDQNLQVASFHQGKLTQAMSEFQRAAREIGGQIAQLSGEASFALRQIARRYEEVQTASRNVGSSSSISSYGGSISGQSSLNNGRDSSESGVQDHGIKNIKVSDLPGPEEINGADDFKKISMADMQTGINKLQEMMPEISSGVGANSDYWAKLDETKGLTSPNGYKDIYDAFYGDNAISIDKTGDKYDILNGRHRIWVAKQMGIEYLPIHLIEK